MDTGTYPDIIVETELSAKWTGLTVTDADIRARSWTLLWFPALLALSPQGSLIRREDGYLPAYEMVPFLRLAEARWRWANQDYGTCQAVLETIGEEFGASGFMPETLYWQGAVALLATGREREMARRWRVLRERYPDSVWTHKTLARWNPRP
ncbi:MAG: hypothetical protein M0Z53_13430 [Thermaerobacter sp.]|nr:hypothetical protein [Thermaerobacter sp.]